MYVDAAAIYFHFLSHYVKAPFTKECKKRSVRLCAWPWRDVARFAGPSIAEIFLNIGPANSFSLYIGYNDTFTYFWLKLF